MEKKIKFIIIGFIAILGISLFINLQTYSSRQIVLRERDGLKKENVSLALKTDELQNLLRNNENKIASLNRELDRLAQEKEELQKNFYKEKEELQKKFNLLTKENKELIEKFKQRPERISGIEEKGKTSFTPLTEDAYWGGILKAKKELEWQLDSIRQELKNAQINSEQFQRDKGSLELEVNNFNRQNQDLQRQLDYNQKLTDSLAQELVREKNDKMQISESVKPFKSENLVLRRQLLSLNNRKISLERKLVDLQKENSILNNRLNEMTALLQERTLEMSKYQAQVKAAASEGTSDLGEESVELPPIVVRPQEEITPIPKTAALLSGTILALNKDNNFVIIDLGQDSGVGAGDTFGVYQEDRSVATIEVIQVRKNISACDIKREISPIKVGDTVR